jgi:hypothetical protein
MRYHRIGRSAAVGLALAALAAPTAGAQQQDSRSPDAVAKTSSLAGTTSDTKVGQDLRSPDAAAKTSSLAGTTADTNVGQDLRSPDARQPVVGRHAVYAPAAAVGSAPQPSADGLDLGDAAIGAGALFGLMALSLGGSLAVAHRRRQTATTG